MAIHKIEVIYQLKKMRCNGGNHLVCVSSTTHGSKLFFNAGISAELNVHIIAYENSKSPHQVVFVAVGGKTIFPSTELQRLPGYYGF